MNMSFCELEAVEVSDIEIHSKALDCLIAYYELEQYNPHLETQHVLRTYRALYNELLTMRLHLTYTHNDDDTWEMRELINRLLDELDSNQRTLKKMYYGRAQQGDS